MVRSTLTTEEARMLADLNSKTVNNANNDAVNKPSSEYNWMARHWDLPFTLMNGTLGMREAGQKYLPKNPKERDDDYKIRLQRAVLTNVFQQTVTNLSSKPFTKPIAVSEDMNQEIVPWLDDIDRDGNDINKFARMVLEDALIAGKTHILAEFPRIDGEDEMVITLADVMERGLRPYMTHIKAQAIIGWKSTIVDGIEILTQVRIREEAKIETGRFSEVTVKRVRVLEPGSFTLWQQDPKTKDWLQIDGGQTNLNFIPLVTFYTNRKGFLAATPPLRDLADLNQSHWESTSDQNHVLHIARVPVMFGKGLSTSADPEGQETSKEIVVSPNSLVHTDNPEGDLKYVEHTGAAIEAGRQHGMDLLEMMESFSMKLLIPRTGNMTATATAIDAASAQSDLQRMVTDLEDTFEAALQFMAELAGIDAETVGTIEMFDDFNIAVGSVEEADFMLRLAIAGKLGTQTLLEEVKRRGLTAENFDAEAETERARQDAGDSLGALLGGQ